MSYQLAAYRPTYCRDVLRVEVVVGEAIQQTGLSHRRVSDDEQLKEVVIGAGRVAPVPVVAVPRRGSCRRRIAIYSLLPRQHSRHPHRSAVVYCRARAVWDIALLCNRYGPSAHSAVRKDPRVLLHDDTPGLDDR